MNKSGSTTIQRSFRGYDDGAVEYLRLRDCPAPFADKGNHSRHIQMRFGQKVSPKFFSSSDPEQQRLERENLSRDFDDGVKAANGSLVVSGETMADARSHQFAESIVRYFEERFDRVEGIVYVRDPFGYMKSLLQQAIRVRPIAPAMGLSGHYPQYRRRLEPWETALSGGRLSFVPFDATAFPEGELLLDFARRTHISEAYARRCLSNGRINVSLSAEAIAVLACYRASHGARPHRGAGRSADARIVVGLKDFGGSRFALSREVVMSVMQDHAADLAWIEARLGRPFAISDTSEGALAFANLPELIDFGRSLGTNLLDWQARKFPKARPAGATPEDILVAVRDSLF